MENSPVPTRVGCSRQRREGADSTDSHFAKTSRKAYGSLGGTARPSIVQANTNENRKDNMIDHVILTVSDFKRSVAFYVKALKPLGITAFMDFEGKDGHPDLKGFGDGKIHFFWLKEGKPDPQAVHVGFVAKDHSEVDAFYKAALAAGGKSKESPQARLEYYPGYYATWVLDPDGHDIEVVHKS
jgi:catechol 2,3-dioxygenase-like lactoylglutathione lyase family enzyme